MNYRPLDWYPDDIRCACLNSKARLLLLIALRARSYIHCCIHVHTRFVKRLEHPLKPWYRNPLQPKGHHPPGEHFSLPTPQINQLYLEPSVILEQNVPSTSNPLAQWHVLPPQTMVTKPSGNTPFLPNNYQYQPQTPGGINEHTTVKYRTKRWEERRVICVL